MIALLTMLSALIDFKAYANAKNDFPETTVIVMRHCARSTPTNIWEPKFKSFDNYTSPAHHPFPKWPVETYQCLPRGITILEEAAKSLLASVPLPRPLSVIADAVQRDNDTARATLRGLGEDENDFSVDATIFEGVCPHDASWRYAAVSNHFKEVPIPVNHTARLKKMQKILGKGVAPALDEIPDYVEKTTGYFDGGSGVASAFAEAFLMQAAGGMEVAWGQLSDSELMDMLRLHIYYRDVNVRSRAQSRASHSNMLDRILKDLDSKKGRRFTWAMTGIWMRSQVFWAYRGILHHILQTLQRLVQ